MFQVGSEFFSLVFFCKLIEFKVLAEIPVFLMVRGTVAAPDWSFSKRSD